MGKSARIAHARGSSGITREIGEEGADAIVEDGKTKHSTSRRERLNERMRLAALGQWDALWFNMDAAAPSRHGAQAAASPARSTSRMWSASPVNQPLPWGRVPYAVLHPGASFVAVLIDQVAYVSDGIWGL